MQQSIAVVLSMALLPFGQWDLLAQPPQPPPQSYMPLDAEQLNQLVAPIALYPDALVAQILTASTYPEQVMEANDWAHRTNLPPQQSAAAADGMPWDPSVKALTAFPTVLETMARNNGWTRDLGNAYYNQPGDVMNAVQAMRSQAYQSGALRSSNHLRVVYSPSLIEIDPVDPAYVYVPYYNPWVVYGGPIGMYRGWYSVPPPRGVIIGVGLGFAAVAIGVGLWAHYGWGWHAWGSNWRGGTVVYNRNTYISNSRTVANYGHFGGYNRGVYEHAGRGVPGNFHPPMRGPVNAGSYHAPAGGGYHAPSNSGSYRSPSSGSYRPPSNSGAHTPSNAGSYHAPSNSGSYRPPTNSGSYRPPTNSGSYHPPSNSGQSHTPGSNSGSFHPGNSGGGTPGYHAPSGQSHSIPQSQGQSHTPSSGGQSHTPSGGGNQHSGGGPSHSGGGGSSKHK